MDFSRFLPNFSEFGWFFQKPTESEGGDFLVFAGFLNTGRDIEALKAYILARPCEARL
jgi:hypothetical protein